MVRLDKLTVRYPRHALQRPALQHITGEFARGSLTAVVGPNGSGKSTLLNSIARLLRPASGTVDVAASPAHIAYLPQLASIERAFPIDVRDCVSLGCWPAGGAWRGASAAQAVHISNALDAVGLQALAQRPIGTLSAGQLQRALFARLVVQDAEVILLDEPFNAIDSKTTALLLGLIAQWHRQQRTVVAVLHDDAQAREHFPQTLMLARECVAWGATDQVLTDANLARARALSAAWDDEADPGDFTEAAPQAGKPLRAWQPIAGRA